MNYAERPTEMLLRQQAALRGAARYRNPETGHRHFCHNSMYRSAFVIAVLAIRSELRKRKEELRIDTAQHSDRVREV